MKKLLQDICREPKYFIDKLTKRSKISAADHSYFTRNGKAIKDKKVYNKVVTDVLNAIKKSSKW